MRASRTKRSTSSGVSCPLRGILTATRRSSSLSCALHTVPKAPTPSFSISSKCAIREPSRQVSGSSANPKSPPHESQISDDCLLSTASIGLWQCGQLQVECSLRVAPLLIGFTQGGFDQLRPTQPFPQLRL